MNQLISRFFEIVRGAWRFRWRGLLVTWIVAALGWTMVWLLRDSYEATARVYVDRDTVLRPLLEGLAVGTDVTSDIKLISAVLLSKPNLTRVAQETDLHLRARTPEEFEALLTGLTKQIRLSKFEALLTGLTKQIRLSNEPMSDTYTIIYADYDRQIAYTVVQTLLDAFVEDTLGVKREDNTTAQEFLQQQIAEYEVRLRAAEDRLAEFKRKNVGLMPGEQGDYYTRMQAGLDQLEALRARQRQVLERRNELARQLEGEEPTFGLVASGAAGPTTPYDAQIAELEAKLEALRVRYTDKHPEVVAVLEAIERLREDKKASGFSEGSLLASGNPQQRAIAALDVNPVYQNLKIALAQTDAELAELRGQIDSVSAQVASLRSRIDTIPQVEAELARLNRDYEVNRAQHAALLQRLEAARITQDAETSREPVKFRVIEPPEVPLLPAAPNRPLLLTAVLILALGAGAAYAYLQSQINPAFDSRSSLEKVLGVPAIGAVSLVRLAQPAAWFRRDPVLVSGCAALLVLLFSVNLVIAL